MALTDTKLRALKATGERREVPDAGGLVLRLSATGLMTWTLTYRVRGAGAVAGSRVGVLAGPKRRITLGEYPTLGLAAARAKAAEVKMQARAGTDAGAPLPILRSPVGLTVSELITRYVAEHLQRNAPRSSRSGEQKLRRHLEPSLGSRLVSELARSDLVELLERVRVAKPAASSGRRSGGTLTRGGPGAAAELRKWARAMCQFAVEVGLRPDNPFADVRNRDRQRPRSRVLSMPELRAVWAATDFLPYPWGPWYRLLMLTGGRRGEWAMARWDWFDESMSRLEIPALSYKTGRSQVVPLGGQARALVASLPRGAAGPYAFSTDDGVTPISGFSKAKAQLDHLIGTHGSAVAPWVVHDLRRSAATHMERIGIEPHVIEVCLGHVLKGVAGTYRHYGYLPEKADALQRWEDELIRHHERGL
jgi:integrase